MVVRHRGSELHGVGGGGWGGVQQLRAAQTSASLECFPAGLRRGKFAALLCVLGDLE